MRVDQKIARFPFRMKSFLTHKLETKSWRRSSSSLHLWRDSSVKKVKELMKALSLIHVTITF